MKSLILMAIATLGLSNASALAKQTITVRNIVCSSGTLDSSKTLAIAYTMLLEGLRNSLRQDASIGKLVESTDDVVLTLLTSGNNDGACKNNGVDTIQIITFTKNKE